MFFLIYIAPLLYHPSQHNSSSSLVFPPLPHKMILLIPAEIRLQIYRELLLSNEAIEIDWKKPKGLYPNILRTCKGILDESYPVLYYENTFKVRLGKSKELKAAVPNFPPLCRHATNSEYDAMGYQRSFTSSYLNDIFPHFLSCSGRGLWRNRDFRSRFIWFDLQDREKLPRRLVITIEPNVEAEIEGLKADIAIMQMDLALLAESLQIPLYSLAIECNTPCGFWATGSGIRLGKMLCAYLKGCARGVDKVTAHNIPEEYAKSFYMAWQAVNQA